MRAKNFFDDLPSIPIDNINEHDVFMFDLTSMQVATEHCHYPELIERTISIGIQIQ